MRNGWLLKCLVVMALLGVVFPQIGQASPTQQDGRLIIGYVVGHDESGYIASTVAGYSRLSGMFNTIGALVREIRLDQAISEDIDLVVIGGPKQPTLTSGEVGRLWSYVEAGGDLLILNDPPPTQGLPANHALNDLLWEDYGIRWRDDLIVEEWFTADAIQMSFQGGSPFQPDRMIGLHAAAIPGHPITFVLGQYNLPVYYWGSRSLELQAPALRGEPVALLKTRGLAYGETRGSQADLEFNIGQDTPPGEVVLGAAVEDFNTGARIVVLGDSEIFKNGYGLELTNNQFSSPLFSGDDIFARAVIRWLMRLPMDELVLSFGNVWMPVDGNLSGWETLDPLFVNEGANPPSIDSIRMTRSERRIYVAIEITNIPYPIKGIVIRAVDSFGDTYGLDLKIDGRLTATITNPQGSQALYGVQIVMGEIVELSLPLQTLPVGLQYNITDFCVEGTRLHCVEFNAPSLPSLGLEPEGRNLLAGFATARVVSTNGLYLRDAVSGGRVLDILSYGEFVNVVGRDNTGNYVQAWVDGMMGWVEGRFLQYPYDDDTYVERSISSSVGSP